MQVLTTTTGGPRAVTLTRFVLLAGAALSALACLAGSAAGRDAATLPVLRIGTAGVPGSQFDASALPGSGRDWNSILGIAYAAVFHMKPGGQIVPGLATSWRYVDRGRGPNKDFEFTLRRDARFSDGTQVDANAVIAWFNYYYKKSALFSQNFGPNPQFQAVGKWTVRMKLTVPTPNLTKILSDGGFMWGFVAAPAAIADPTRLVNNSHGAGPYMLDASQSVTNDHYTYVPNPYYYDKKAITFSQVYVKVVAQPSSMLQALQAGQLDIAAGAIPTASAASAAGFNVAWASVATVTFGLGATGRVQPALKDSRVRQALNYAIDRKTLVQAIASGFARPTSVIFSADVNDPKAQSYYDYDPARGMPARSVNPSA